MGNRCSYIVQGMITGDRLGIPGLILVGAGIVALVVAALQGDLGFAIVFVFPVILGEGVLPALGGLMLFSGLVMVFLSFIIRCQARVGEVPAGPGHDGDDLPSRQRYGGLVLIGPIPIVIGSDRRMVLVMAVLALVVLGVVLVLLII